MGKIIALRACRFVVPLLSLSSPAKGPASPLRSSITPLSPTRRAHAQQEDGLPNPPSLKISDGLTQKQRGIQYIFIAEFSNKEDRKYYLEKDPAHLAFVEDLKKSGFLANATVVDFTPGEF